MEEQQQTARRTNKPDQDPNKLTFNNSCIAYLRGKFNELYNRTSTPEDVWKEMCFMLGGLNVKFPKGTRGKVGKRILNSIDKGYTTRQLADIYGTSTANIRAIKRYYKNKVKK